jgi:para-aminobenzoate synthetase component I
MLRLLSNKEEIILQMNKWGQEQCPFLFLIDFKAENAYLVPIDNYLGQDLAWDYSKVSKYNFSEQKKVKDLDFKAVFISQKKYEDAFQMVLEGLNYGDSFLCNLTASTKLLTENSLYDFYSSAHAYFKLYLKDHFVFFSPEPFVEVNGKGILSSKPMKGTINAGAENAKSTILADPKERFEHTTIVDLIRNDLSKVCQKVWVEQFRYIDEIKKNNGEMLLQVSSEVKGQLNPDWKGRLGDWLFQLLPAGSISGAPKESTLALIEKAEENLHKNGRRNFYTGVAGIFTGETFHSSVMIRYIEQDADGHLFFKSGGGITARSKVDSEYEEIKQKVYVPVF